MKKFIKEFRYIFLLTLGSMLIVCVFIFYLIFFLLPNYNIEEKYIGTIAVLSFFIPIIVMYHVRNYLINRLILSYKNDIREIIDRTVLSGDIEEDLYVKILRKNKLENFSLEKPIVKTPNLEDCIELISFEENNIIINENIYDISKMRYYSFVADRNFETKSIINFNLFMRIGAKEYKERINTTDSDKIFKISKMFYKSLLEYNNEFEFPSIKVSLKAKGKFQYNKY